MLSAKWLVLLYALSIPAVGQVINAASCSSADVQTAFTAVTSSTTTINIPACTGGVAWTTGVTLTVPSGNANLTIIGAGTAAVGGGDQTVIIDNVSHSPTDNPTLVITTNATSTSKVRLSGITIKSNGSSSASFNGSVVITGSSANFRFDHSHLAQLLDGKQMRISGCVYGVMDSSILDLTAASTNNAVFLNQGSCGGDSLGVGNGQWNEATNAGTAQSFYFENDVFNGGTNSGGSGATVVPFADDCSGGGRFVFRFNTLNGVEAQGHATGHSNNPPDRSCRAYEIYQNVFGSTGSTSTTNPAEATFFNTGGTGYIWGNTFTGFYKNMIEEDEDRINNVTYTQAAPPAGWGYCATSPVGGVPGPSNWDQNTSGQAGWACLDQVGRGQGDLLQGSFPNVCDATSSDCTNSIFTGRWPNQALEPVYEWLDQWHTPSGWSGVLWSGDGTVTLSNRDFYTYTLAWSGSAFTGTAFNGTVGTGSGVLASRPSTCTTGVAYWATDQGSWNSSGGGGQGVLYKCTATNTWTTSYTPYAYPHPLTQTNTTWYIRPDGGTSTQCTGKTNAAYPGSGTGVACAFNHPYWMIASGGTTWAHMVGGDTIQFVNTSGTSDTYYMGEENGGLGFDWNGNGLSSICPTPNSGGGAGTSCILPAPPSGTASQHTRILGQNVGSCHDSAHAHLVNPTILSGINTVFAVLDTRSTNYVDIDCIMITQPDTCTLVATGLANECTGSSNITKYGGLILNFGSGSQGAANLTLTDFAVVGLSGSGILGSKLNLLSSDALTASDVYIIGNGGSGWNGDSGGCGTGCESIGTMNLSHMIIDWNGCQAVTPYDMTKPDTQNAFNYCYDQSSGNGLGDGFVQIAAGNMTLNVDHSFFRWNTQDGFDALHLSDDITTSPVTNISTSWSEGNEGQTIKIGAGASSTAINNMSISNCHVFLTASNFPLNPTGWNTGVVTSCRASGDQWSFQVKDGTSLNPVVITLENNTSVGYGTTMYDIGCAALATCTNLFGVVFKNNLNKGYPDPGNGNVLASGWYLGGPGMSGLFSNASSAISFNLWNTMDTGCPDSSIPSSPETNFQCGDPLLVGESNINAINPNITNASSPALGNGVHIPAITTDYNGNAVTNPPQIGAFGKTGVTPPTNLQIGGSAKVGGGSNY